MHDLELWGGPECTVNRVGDRWGDQFRLSGHHDRDDDVALFAELGLKRVRYPVLWERIAPESPDRCDWSWTDARLGRLRESGVHPIAGLVHHGSGPHYTSLLDPDFPAKLGDYAARVAERYPWIEDWTPVNEPLTTARFSALYGHWYPHHRDEGSFWRALVNQVDGVAHAMRAVRAHNPAARLIQTDDLGRSYSTAPLAGQAAFDNLRRWAGWDLLFGRVTPHHPLWERLCWFGLEPQLHRLVEAPCPPDMVGVNHYLTSDRFLDHRLQRYPAHTHGGNHEQRYADVEAIRVLDPAPAGLAGVLREAWDRYRTPLAVTESHLGCTREEQLRWAAEAWDTAAALRGEGVDIRAVTAWALFGSCNWNTLLTCDGVYEPGVYDVSSGRARPTTLSELWRGLPKADERHPVAAGPGWWRRPVRFAYPPAQRPASPREHQPITLAASAAPAPLLVCGGAIADGFAGACAFRGIVFVHGDADAATLDRHRPWAVVHAPDWPDAPGDPAALVRAAAARGIATLTLSSDRVLLPGGDRPFTEADAGDPVHPLAAVERASAEQPGRHLAVRTGPLFAADHGWASAIADRLAAGNPVALSADGARSFASLPTVVDAALDLLIDGAEGVWHLSHGRHLSEAEFARALARACGLDERLVQEQATGAARVMLESGRGAALPCFDAALARFAVDRVALRLAEVRAA